MINDSKYLQTSKQKTLGEWIIVTDQSDCAKQHLLKSATPIWKYNVYQIAFTYNFHHFQSLARQNCVLSYSLKSFHLYKQQNYRNTKMYPLTAQAFGYLQGC